MSGKILFYTNIAYHATKRAPGANEAFLLLHLDPLIEFNMMDFALKEKSQTNMMQIKTFIIVTS